MYNTEREFVTAFLKHCKSQGIYTMRIETARTINGCPDAWIQGAGDDFWIEFKNITATSSEAHSQVVVPWRPGQQAWFRLYTVNHTTAKQAKFGWTVVAIDNEIWFIRMDKVYTSNVVNSNDSSVYVFAKDAFSKLDILSFLKQYSYKIN